MVYRNITKMDSSQEVQIKRHHSDEKISELFSQT